MSDNVKMLITVCIYGRRMLILRHRCVHDDSDSDAESGSNMVLRVVILETPNQQPNRTKSMTEPKVICEGQLEPHCYDSIQCTTAVSLSYKFKYRGGEKLRSHREYTY